MIGLLYTWPLAINPQHGGHGPLDMSLNRKNAPASHWLIKQ